MTGGEYVEVDLWGRHKTFGRDVEGVDPSNFFL
jgi:hypothetical protein